MRKGFLIYEELRKYLTIYDNMRRPLVMYDFAVHPQNVRFQNVRFKNVRFQNVMFTKRQVYKTSGFKTSGFKTSSSFCYFLFYHAVYIKFKTRTICLIQIFFIQQCVTIVMCLGIHFITCIRCECSVMLC